MNSKIVYYIAGTVGFAMLGAELWPTPLGQSGIGVAVLCLIGAIVHGVHSIIEARKHDKYDLRRLYDLHVEEPDEDEINAYDTSGNPVCLNCGDEYDPRLGACPRCKCQF